MLSNSGKYGLRVAYELARSYDSGPVSSREISDRQNIPLKNLDYLLFQLHKSQIIHTYPLDGLGIGYRLASPPENLSVGTIFRFLEGPFLISGCVNSGQKEHCDRIDTCISIIFWTRIEAQIESLLQLFSLRDLAQMDPAPVAASALKKAAPPGA